MANTLKKRSEVAVADTWKIEDMYADLTAWEADLTKISELADKMAAMKGQICVSGTNLYAYYKLDEQLSEVTEKAFNYASRLSDQDTTNTDNQNVIMKMRSFYAGVMQKLSFVRVELLKGLSERLDSLYAEEPKLHEFDVQIKSVLRFKDHTLSEEQESIMALASEVLGGPSNVFGMFNNADITFPTLKLPNGEDMQISHGRYRVILEHPDGDVRREGFQKYYKSFIDYKNTMAANYQNLVKSHIFSARARKYPSCLDAAVFSNDVPSSVYRNLLDVVNSNLDKLHRYMALRKEVLKMEEQHMYDIFIPLVDGVDKEIPFEEAKQMVIEALAPMGEEYVSHIKEAFENRWIDIYENEGKRSGAYSAGVYGVHPYVLLNYDGKLDSVFTLIHELGHAMHSYMSAHAQRCMDSDYVIFVAEVASTCNEALLTQYLLKKTTDPKTRAYIINHLLDDFRTTLYRQAQFAEFELATHEMAEKGQSLTADSLSKLYMEINKKYYGDAVISDDEIAYEWIRIPHFYYNFYVYQYSTGFSAALALSNKILTEGQPAVDNYFKFLSGGCTMSPIDLLRTAGVDMESPKPIQDALNIFADMMDELEKIVK